MSKRKASEASTGSSAKRSSSSTAETALPFDLAASNPKIIASTLLSLLPGGATKQHNGAKNLLKAFDLVRAQLDHNARNANKLPRKAETRGATQEFSFLDEQVRMPEDVFLHILEYLPKPVLVHRASFVCKRWLSATKIPWLWSKLEIDAGIPRRMNMDTLLKLLARPQFSCLKTLVLPDTAQYNKLRMKKLAQLCPLLEELGAGYNNDILSVSLVDEQLVALPNHFPNLTKIRLNMWKLTNVSILALAKNMADRLLDLRIKGCISNSFSDSTLIQIASDCPNLERFEYFFGCSWLVRHDEFSEIGVMALLRSCTKLKHLVLVDTKKVGLAAFEFIADAEGSQLRHLDVEGVPSLFGSANADRVRSRLEEHIEETNITASSECFRDWHYRNYEHRKIRVNMREQTNVGISSLAKNMADRLLDLRIKGYTYAPRNSLSDSTLLQVASVCPNLERFEYFISSHYVIKHDGLSEIGVMALLRSCTKLKHLVLVDTKKVGLAAFEFIADAEGSHLRHLDVGGVPSLFGSANADRVRSRLEEHIEETIITASSERFRDWHYRRRFMLV